MAEAGRMAPIARRASRHASMRTWEFLRAMRGPPIGSYAERPARCAACRPLAPGTLAPTAGHPYDVRVVGATPDAASPARDRLGYRSCDPGVTPGSPHFPITQPPPRPLHVCFPHGMWPPSLYKTGRVLPSGRTATIVSEPLPLSRLSQSLTSAPTVRMSVQRMPLPCPTRRSYVSRSGVGAK